MSFVLRFTRHSIPNVALKFATRKSEPSAEELKSTVSFRLPDSLKPATDAGSTTRATEQSDAATREASAEELKSTASFRLPNKSDAVTEAESKARPPERSERGPSKPAEKPKGKKAGRQQQ